ncbi:MAG: helix-turn-helix domain-containing protein [Clostridiales bacterium]|jgi:excisionase family DNA binding protein|nr:helix-turn-helix domain-containing protein [Clostridiales bacterium]
MDKADSEKWVDTKAVAEHLNINRQTVFAWIAQRKLPAVRVGKAWRFKLSEIDTWLRSGGAKD